MAAKSVAVHVPATSANLGPGFDCLGLALDLWGSVTLAVSERSSGTEAPSTLRPFGPSASLRAGFAQGRLRSGQSAFGGSGARMALTAARAFYDRLGCDPPAGLSAQYDGAIPVARGLGASAVARVGGLVAANALAGQPLDREELLALAAGLEGHADNAAPALFGGLQVAVRDGDRVLRLGVRLAQGLRAVLFVPELRMPTQRSRQLLPRALSRAEAVQNIGRAALLVVALTQGRFDLLDAATQDRLHQPARAQLFPAMFAIFDAARAAGAHCAYLSGGGSTICALASGNEHLIADAMAEAARSREVEGRTIVTAPTERGAEVVEGS